MAHRVISSAQQTCSYAQRLVARRILVSSATYRTATTASKPTPSSNAPKPPSSQTGSPHGSASATAPLSSTTGTPGQSPAIENHASTSHAELEPLPNANTSGYPPAKDSPPPSSSAQGQGEGSGAGTGTGTGGRGLHDWSRSFHGLSTEPFPSEISNMLLAEIVPEDVEIKPDGLLYLPEIKYRRILNKAFGPGGWGLAPRGDSNVGTKIVSREYGLVCLGRLVSIARGEQEYFDPSGVPTAIEACKSNALMRCCKDLGIASELWDPRFIRTFKAKYCVEAWVEHVPTKKKRKLWRRKDAKFEYPYSEGSSA